MAAHCWITYWKLKEHAEFNVALYIAIQMPNESYIALQIPNESYIAIQVSNEQCSTFTLLVLFYVPHVEI